MIKDDDKHKLSHTVSNYNFDHMSGILKGLQENQRAFAIDMSGILKGLQVNQRAFAIDMSNILKGLQVNQRAFAIDMSNILKGLQVNQRAFAIDMSGILKGLQVNQRSFAIDMSGILKGLQVNQRAFAIDMSNILKGLQANQWGLDDSSISILSNEVDISKISQAILDEEFIESVNEENLVEIIDEFSFIGYDQSDNLSNMNVDYEDQINKSYNNILELLNIKADSALKKLQEFKEKYTALCVLLAVLSYLFYPAIDEVRKDVVLNSVNYENKSPKQHVKKIKKELIITFKNDNQFLNNVRVTNRKTPVFSSSSQKSKRIGYIDLNRPVVILSKEKKWCFVMYKDKEEAEYAGWVFTGNLSK